MAEVGRGPGRSALCEILAELVKRGQQVTVIFDGPAPTGPQASHLAAHGIEVAYSGAKKADDLICQRIAASSAPRRLTVVSTDRQIRQAARKRRCKSVRSEEFARMLVQIESTSPQRPAEPPEKREGLTSEQTAEWLREFGFDETQ